MVNCPFVSCKFFYVVLPVIFLSLIIRLIYLQRKYDRESNQTPRRKENDKRR